MILHLWVPKYHCQRCDRYCCRTFAGLRLRYRSSDTYQMEVYEAHVTQFKLPRTHQISGATVERWYRDHLSIKRSEMDRRRCPRVLGIDEYFFTRRSGSPTLRSAPPNGCQ